MDPKYNGILWTGSELLDITAPDPAKINLGEIAQGLATKYRFGGLTIGTRRPYSVAWHSLFCESIADHLGVALEVRLQALFHDAPEYILGDMQTPLKALLPDFHALEMCLWQAIAARFDIDPEMDATIHAIDQIALEVERKALLPDGAWNPAPNIPPEFEAMGAAWMDHAESVPYPMEMAAALFKARATALLNARDQVAA